METLKFGYQYFKKNMPVAILAEALSFLGIYAELLLPLLSGLLIDFVIQGGEVKEDSGGIFHFLLTGRFGEPHTMRLFFSIATAFGILMLLRIVLIYIRDLMQEWIGLKLETNLRYMTYGKLMELDSATIAEYNSGELLQILNSDTIMFKELFSHRIPYLGDAVFMLVMTLALIAGIDLSPSPDASSGEVGAEFQAQGPGKFQGYPPEKFGDESYHPGEYRRRPHCSILPQ